MGDIDLSKLVLRGDGKKAKAPQPLIAKPEAPAPLEALDTVSDGSLEDDAVSFEGAANKANLEKKSSQKVKKLLIMPNRNGPPRGFRRVSANITRLFAPINRPPPKPVPKVYRNRSQPPVNNRQRSSPPPRIASRAKEAADREKASQELTLSSQDAVPKKFSVSKTSAVSGLSGGRSQDALLLRKKSSENAVKAPPLKISSINFDEKQATLERSGARTKTDKFDFDEDMTEENIENNTECSFCSVGCLGLLVCFLSVAFGGVVFIGAAYLTDSFIFEEDEIVDFINLTVEFPLVGENETLLVFANGASLDDEVLTEVGNRAGTPFQIGVENVGLDFLFACEDEVPLRCLNSFTFEGGAEAAGSCTPCANGLEFLNFDTNAVTVVVIESSELAPVGTVFIELENGSNFTFGDSSLIFDDFVEFTAINEAVTEVSGVFGRIDEDGNLNSIGFIVLDDTDRSTEPLPPV